MVALTQWIVYFLFINCLAVQNNVSLVLIQDGMIYWFITVTIIICLSGYLINDAFDKQTDLINQKENVLSLTQLLGCYFFLFFIGLLISYQIAIKLHNPWLSFIYLIAMIGLYCYSAFLKGKTLWGNILVAGYAALVIGVLWFAEMGSFKQLDLESYHWIQTVLVAFMSFAFLVNLLREWIKDMEDYHGDKEAGLNTLAVVKGNAFVSKLSQGFIFLICILMLLWIAFIQKFESFFYHISLLLCLALLVYMYVLLSNSTASDAFRKISGLAKMVLLLGLIYLITLTEFKCIF